MAKDSPENPYSLESGDLQDISDQLNSILNVQKQILIQLQNNNT